METEKMNLDQAIALAAELPECWITEYSRVFFGPTPDHLDPEEWTEAHFFDETRELRFFRDGSNLSFSLLTDGDADCLPDLEVTLKLPTGTRKAWIRRCVESDEDGQTCISAVRFLRKEGAK